ncbi:putative uncharacterized protein DDB_G0275317 isoform X2 [Tigriopus californicus]|uniref:putative uncharacterized protein DDB_G0275317 isoform X2 n=1 Tax=Tigriopus californicus TaxID=6832 RepID=UPI0027DA49A3|nr:putative uncharacterized protein DDB_G0275317 isoform X2 [Tigriopus californicus]
MLNENCMSRQGRLSANPEIAFPSLSSSLGGSTISMMTFVEDPQMEEFDSEVLVRAPMSRKLARLKSSTHQTRSSPQAQTTLQEKDNELKRLRVEQDRQLASICRQMLALECGLRRKEKELENALDQKDTIIREQMHIIKFLLQKTGTKTRNIRKLKDEALAKIPQVVPASNSPTMEVISTVSPIHLTTIRVNSGPPSSSLIPRRTSGSSGTSSSFQSSSPCIREENDSDSAIILDESLNRTISSSSDSLTLNRRLSRSISDVMTINRENPLTDTLCSKFSGSDSLGSKPASSSSDCECSYSVLGEDTHISQHGYYNEFDYSQYRGFLLRNGSYERYKIKSRLRKEMVDRGVDRKNLSVTAGSGSVKNHEKTSLCDSDPTNRNQCATSNTKTQDEVLNNNSGPFSAPHSSSNNSSNNNNNDNNNSTGGTGSLYGPISSSGALSQHQSAKHRHVTKPRDIKNRRTRKITHSWNAHYNAAAETCSSEKDLKTDPDD